MSKHITLLGITTEYNRMACNSPLKPSSETEKMDDGDAIIVSVYIHDHGDVDIENEQ